MIKSRRMRWTMYVARMEKMRNAYAPWSENLKGRDLGVDGMAN
jgi:hypothetical protein